jgi:thiamine-phosphate pyrophosphorylase
VIRIVLVTDPAFADERIVSCIRHAAGALPPGALCVQLRDRRRARTGLRLFASRLRHVTRDLGVSLVVNGDAEIARDVGADGVHLPERAESSVSKARAVCGPRAWISVAAHSDDATARAVRDGADAVLVSPVFSKDARGVAALRSARSVAARALQIYALGGVTPDNARSCALAGADGVAVIRALLASDEPARAARRLHDALTSRC